MQHLKLTLALKMSFLGFIQRLSGLPVLKLNVLKQALQFRPLLSQRFHLFLMTLYALLKPLCQLPQGGKTGLQPVMSDQIYINIKVFLARGQRQVFLSCF
ncbi:hypothetical protein SDC9_113349 [bioreactor metagenome]|uniref:Uncharacterized protein n=1 Tax=bioreactor metagenome TaxID=1076179 RepID=A0A645BMN8_9ZZZZ